MKKFLKILLITFLSLLAAIIAVSGIILWLVFTPERITPLVHKQAKKLITCQSEIGEIELTLFSTFPDVGLKIKNLSLINRVAGSPSDTLLRVDEFLGIVDASAWMNRKELKLNGLELTGGSVNIFSDSLGNTNYDIFPPGTDTSSSSGSETAMPLIDIRTISLNNVNLRYTDLSSKLDAVIRDLSTKISGTFAQDSISGTVNLGSPSVSFEYNGEKYLRDASVKFNIPVDIILSRQFIRLKNASAGINDLELKLDGTVENDTLRKTLITDLSYKFSSWPVKKILAVVPPSYHSQLKGMEVDGNLSSEGSIKGPMNDSIMPLMNIHLLMDKGSLKYPDFPLPLHDISADIGLISDLKTDSISVVHIKQLNASTPQSTLDIKGSLHHLFSDIYCNLTTSADLTLDEFNPMIPDSLKADIRGRAAGKILSTFYLSQMEKMQFEKIKLSGSLNLSGLKVSLDSISLDADRSRIDFSLPNRKPSSENTKFAVASILLDNMTTGKLESYNASMQNAALNLELSDVRDTTRIPDLICTFRMDSVYAAMDTLKISVVKPDGKLILSPRPGKSDQMRIMVTYNSGQMKTLMGKNAAVVKKISLDTDIQNDNTQKDIFLQWLARGFINVDQGVFSISGLTHPVEIPAIEMNFEPEKFSIRDARMKIDRSDFKLSGNLNNVLSYFRGDSILRGKFNFVSDTTDIGQLMALTNGLGNKDTIIADQPGTETVDSSYTGPYIVPKGIDFALNARVKTALMGIDTASDINGDVLVHDGVLLLDGLSFTTPAARMQMTAMYRTPRKNHLFLGLDYHMLDVEIGHLLTMIPDIDSLMPMLRSFKGKGEFHIAVETYLDSMYNLKKSTLRGASSIRGNNLVLMDGETFSEISKKLRFSKKAENIIDSLSAEFTIFRNEIDIYPFLIVMDKYRAVIAGRHNFDLSYDYHISIVDSPLPIKLGLDVKGNMDDLSFSLASCRYAEYYRPTARRVVENKQLELRKMIRDALTEKVME